MFGIVNLISNQITGVDVNNPLSVVDLTLAIFLVVGFLFYMHRFPVFRVVVGVFFLTLAAIGFLLAGFVFTALVFGAAANIVLISLPLIFAPEIRHYLEKLGRLSLFRASSFTRKQRSTLFMSQLTNACFDLAKKKIGASIVIQRKTGLGETIETGVLMNAIFSSSLLQSIFFPKSPLHDGAVVLVNKRIFAAKCLLPISSNVRLDAQFGTRHAASVAITMDTDAFVIIVSEQRGEVSLAENGKLVANVSRSELLERIRKLLS